MELTVNVTTVGLVVTAVEVPDMVTVEAVRVAAETVFAHGCGRGDGGGY